MMEIIHDWWKIIDPQNKLEQKTSKIADLMVSKKIAQDADTATKIIYKATNKREKVMTYEDFNKIFCKCIFKDSLISMTENIDA